MFQCYGFLHEGQEAMTNQSKQVSLTHQDKHLHLIFICIVLDILIQVMYDGRQFQAFCISKCVPSTYLSSPQKISKVQRSLAFFWVRSSVRWQNILCQQAAGWTALHLSAAGGHQDVARMLLKQRAEVNKEVHFHGSMGRGFWLQMFWKGMPRRITQMEAKWGKHGQTIQVKQFDVVVTLVETIMLPNKLATFVELSIFQKLVPLKSLYTSCWWMLGQAVPKASKKWQSTWRGGCPMFCPGLAIVTFVIGMPIWEVASGGTADLCRGQVRWSWSVTGWQVNVLGGFVCWQTEGLVYIGGFWW